MDNINKEEILKVINKISQMGEINITHVALIVNTQDQVKMLRENLSKEILSYVHMWCADGRLESDDKVYILPCGDKLIKFTWED